MSPTLAIARGYLERAKEALQLDPTNMEKLRAVQSWMDEVKWHENELKKAAN
jgi:hypothetical protein